MATIAEIVGVTLPDNAGEDSQSFASVLRNADANHDRRPLINHGATGGRYSITEGTWKLILPSKDNLVELYDLSTDPGETRNLASEHPEKLQDLKKKITAIVIKGRTTAGTPQRNDTGHW